MNSTTSPRPAAYYAGKITTTARHYANHVTRYGRDNPITRATGHALDMAVRAALVRGGLTWPQVTAAAGIVIDDDPCAEVRAELDRPIVGAA